MGVRRALELVLKATRDRQHDETIYTYGPLIHNNQVLEMLEMQGVRCLESLPDPDGGRIAIRAHGIPPQERRALKNRGLKIINATCPRVARVQGIIKKHVLKGHEVVIVGDDNHAEVIGLKGFANGRAWVVSSPEEVDLLPEMDKLLVVAQTTQDEQVFHGVVRRLKARYPQAKIYNTICDSTSHRQEEVRTLSREVEALVVVGGRHSANTRRLAEIARGTEIPTFHVETEEELDREQLQEFSVVGVTAGASTPNWLIKQVVQKLESIQPRSARLLVRVLDRLVKFLVQSNLSVAAGAACLSYAAAVLQGIPPKLVDCLITLFYVFAMHVLNRYADKAARFNDPARAAFYERYKIPFSLAGLGSVVLALCLAATQGTGIFLALLAMTALGLLYSVRIFPESWLSVVRVAKLKDIPASKTLFIAGGWSAVVTLLPGMRNGWPLGWPVFYALAVFFILVFVRSALFDILEIQGDRLVGEETIPIVIGEKRTRRLLACLVVVLAVLLALAPSLGIAGGFSYLLLLSCGYMGLYLLVHRRELMRVDSLRFEALVDASLYIPGGLALLYKLIAG
jgi:4-hydroxy-3-methylbut-2-enyl diphosphate reductase